MEKCLCFNRSGKAHPAWLNFGEWFIVRVVLIALLAKVRSSYGCFRTIGRVARRPIQSMENLAAVPRQTQLLPDLSNTARIKDPKVNPLDRYPSDAIHVVQVEANRWTQSLSELPTVQAGTRQGRLRDTVRNGGKPFLGTLVSFSSYSRHMLRNIHIQWRSFRETHPAATKCAKWVSWLGGIAVSVGSAILLPIELYRTFHGLKQTDTVIMARIDNVTNSLERLTNQSIQEFETYPDQTIFNLYHSPLKHIARDSYRLGIEGMPRSEDNPTEMDPLFQDIPGFPKEIEDALKSQTTIAASTTQISRLEKRLNLRQQPMISINQTSRLGKGLTLADETSNTTGNPITVVPVSHLEKGLTWYDLWETKRLSPRVTGWIMLAMAGFIFLLVYASLALRIRRCCVFTRSRMSLRRDSSRALPTKEP